MADQYEFNASEDETIKTTGARASVWGIIAIIIGVFQVLMGGFTMAKGGGLTAAGTLAGGVVGIIVGTTFLGVGKSLKGVVETKGNDLSLMMGALTKLTSAFTIQIAVSIGAFVVGFIAGAMGAMK